ncbi:hypothetical protein [Cupriavidus sp. TMH.W2]|uniref:hypothetical protein n=1 Tax=Cupriavidus sp. TMH.W2 TaxID=3434465 RepID=UPI003D77417C
MLIISPLAEYEALVRTLGGTECVVLPDGQIRLRKGYSKLFLLTWDGLASNKPRFSATLKQLGFQKPDLREILLVADEIHAYARDPWFLEMLTELMPHECATTMLIAQDAREAIVPALVARAGSLRIFRQYDFVARQLLDRDTAVEAVQLETGQSIVRKVAFLTAATDTAGLRFVDPAVVRAVLANTATRIFMKVVAPESNSPQEE